MASGHYGAGSRVFRVAKQHVIRAGQYEFSGRKQKKRDFRSLWITRINAGVRTQDLSYSKFMHGLKNLNIELDRKILSHLAVHQPDEFQQIVSKVKESLSA